MITLEDCLEELVGEIVDEYDREEPMVERVLGGRVRVNARIPVDELNEVLGPDVAGDLMESLPPFDWTRIATKDDLQLIHGRLDNVDRRFDNLDRRLDLLDKRVGITMLKMNIASTIVLLGAMSGLLAIFR